MSLQCHAGVTAIFYPARRDISTGISDMDLRPGQQARATATEPNLGFVLARSTKYWEPAGDIINSQHEPAIQEVLQAEYDQPVIADQPVRCARSLLRRSAMILV
jgi:hypothetical protein